jgi:hypothetical protein
MRLLSSHQSGKTSRTRLIDVVVAASLLAAAQPVSATTWGHLRSPFSAESERVERANFAAEERSIRREAGARFSTASCTARYWNRAVCWPIAR